MEILFLVFLVILGFVIWFGCGFLAGIMGNIAVREGIWEQNNAIIKSEEAVTVIVLGLVSLTIFFIAILFCWMIKKIPDYLKDEKKEK